MSSAPQVKIEKFFLAPHVARRELCDLGSVSENHSFKVLIRKRPKREEVLSQVLYSGQAGQALGKSSSSLTSSG